MRKNIPKKTQDASQTPILKMPDSLCVKDKPSVGKGKRKQQENYVAILGYD